MGGIPFRNRSKIILVFLSDPTPIVIVAIARVVPLLLLYDVPSDKSMEGGLKRGLSSAFVELEIILD